MKIFFKKRLISFITLLLTLAMTVSVLSSPLRAAHVGCTDLRGGAALLLSALCAEGESVIERAELIERGYITECSFAFWVAEDRWQYDIAFGDKTYDVRRIERLGKLADLSIVVSGQYGQTSVSVEERAMVDKARQAGKPTAEKRTMSVRLAKAITDTLS